eukprot:TRINITY_DN3512_c0_g1_i1.p1 TRINITY_DN3512_c0_g1~~TRINITY_DN3512_c0_g1_i1.p1  ORF type:complete len:245 (-),score=66.45 TRINITY_DN3512_c0_g1_i1:109-843(-)
MMITKRVASSLSSSIVRPTLASRSLSLFSRSFSTETNNNLNTHTNKIPDAVRVDDIKFPTQHWDHYIKPKPEDEPESRSFAYLVVGGAGVGIAASAKNAVVTVLSAMAPAADVLAVSSVEVDLSEIEEGTSVLVKWRGKPLFIRHRTAAEIDDAASVDVGSLPDPQPDDARVVKPEWLVLVGVCTHLGCIPIGGAGDFGGWFCPCHGSHYDISGRIRKGPAPQNLQIPPYRFTAEKKIVVGDDE